MTPALIDTVGGALEIAGVVLLLGGLSWALVRAARPAAAGRYAGLRHDIGRAILVALEVLVAADIVRTVVLAPTMASLAALAAIVAIRTFPSWSLALELDGRWPWQRPAPQPQTPETPR